MPGLLKTWAHLDRPAPIAPPTPQVTFDSPPVGHQSLLGYYGSDWGWKPIERKDDHWHCKELGILNHSIQPFKFALPGEHR